MSGRARGACRSPADEPGPTPTRRCRRGTGPRAARWTTARSGSGGTRRASAPPAGRDARGAARSGRPATGTRWRAPPRRCPRPRPGVMSMRSTTPSRSNAHCAAARSISRKLPSSSLAGPSASSSARTRSVFSRSPMMMRSGSPTSSPCRSAKARVITAASGSVNRPRMSIAVRGRGASAPASPTS